MVATHTENICHLISHTAEHSTAGAPATSSAASRVARCRIAFDREVGAVALAGGNRDTFNGKIDDGLESPVLLVADVSGRLWRSQRGGVSSTGGGIAFAKGWLDAGRGADTPADKQDAPAFDMVQLKPGNGRRRCLPLGVDRMSILICQQGPGGTSSAASNAGSPLGQGILLVATGSQSISPPVVTYVPNTNSSTNEKVILEDIVGLDSGCIVSTLMVSKDAVGIVPWRRLLRAMADPNDDNGVDAAANAAVFLGTGDGSVYCSLVSFQHVGKEGPERPMDSMRTTPAKQIHRMAPTQAVSSMFLIPNAPLQTSSGPSLPNLLAIVGRLGSVSVLDFSSAASSDAPLFISKSTALPHTGTCTSACSYRHCRMEQDMKKERNDFTILATFDDGSSFSCPLEIESARQGPSVLQKRSPATRLPIRRDAAVVLADPFKSDSETSNGVYMLTFGGALVGLRAETEHQVASSLEGSKVTGKITTALKRLCDATNIDTTTTKSSKFGIGHGNATGAIRETRDAGRLVSQQNASKWQSSDRDINTDQWFQTRHVQQPMLSDVVGSQPSATKDLAALYYADRDGESIKVAYSGAALNECTPIQDGKSPQEVKQIANQWNRRPLMTSSTICCTFKHSTEKETGSKVQIGTRTQDNNGPSPSNTKRKLHALVGSPGACAAKSAYSDARHNDDEILGLVTGILDGTDAPAARWSVLGDAVCGIVEEIEQDRSSNKRARVVSANLEDVESAMIQNKMCGQTDDRGKTKQNVSGQSILLSSCSTIAKKIAQKKSLALDGGAAGELESVSLEVVPLATDNDQGSTKIRYGVTPSSSESEDPRSILSLLRSCIVGMLAKRLAAPGEASIPVGEIEAATLLEAYRKAIKNPRTKKMAMYLATKADEFFAKMKQKETEEDGNDDEAFDVESVFLLYNQLRAIPLPLG